MAEKNANNETDQGSMNSVREQQKAEDARSTQNNANNIRNAADVAIASKNPYAMAAGAIVKGADKLTGGKSTELLGKGMTKANKISPGGKKIQKASNKLNESGASDKIGKAASMKSGGGGGAANAASKGAQGAQNAQRMKDIQAKQQAAKQQGQKIEQQANSQYAQYQAQQQNQNGSKGGQDGSPSSSGKEEGKSKQSSQDSSGGGDSDSNEKKEGGLAKGVGKFLLKGLVQAIIISILPYLFLLIPVVLAIGCVEGLFSNHDDDFAISDTTGGETGDVTYTVTSEDQEMFLLRVNEVYTYYVNMGKTFDPIYISSTFTVLNANGAGLTYNDMTTDAIKLIVLAMFDEYGFNESTFRENLIYTIIPTYLPETTSSMREVIADEIIDHAYEYYDLVGVEKERDKTDCVVGDKVCTYNVKGFSVSGKGNVNEDIQPSNIQVRLMQCSSSKAISGEELIPFENYILGVGYMEFKDSSSKEELKAQFVALRSYVLSKHVSSSGSNNTLKEESNGNWVLQISTCSSDPLYCNPTKGCSIDNSNILHSGIVENPKFKKDPMPDSSIIKEAHDEVLGELLVNSQGYIISSNYKNASTQISSLASQGLNYKSILLQVFNQGTTNLGASDIQKNTCNPSVDCGGGSGTISTGEFATWRQGDSRWGSIQMGNGGATIRSVGCLATSLAILIAKSGVPTNVSPLTPGTFVQYLNPRGGFDSGGSFNSYSNVEKVAPTFKYQSYKGLEGKSKQEKFNIIKDIVTQPGVYAIVEVKGNTGQHWVAIDSISGDVINMMDPSSDATNMWAQYNWANTSRIVYFKVG